ncbi:50S ribosomal protein L18 [Candidatus Kaiserbacteria bacterium]|nr:50S ribosomal protein L18 [Candidatus Kaiserbacteria bacterium]MCB9812252.1 50S ribosomal protein L18 [Candidatus Nomurabacteria bacterium]
MTNKSSQKTAARAKRHNRLRHKVSGTAARPRLAVYKSNTAVYAQLIDDVSHKTLAAADSRKEKGTQLEAAKAVGTAVAKKAADLQVTEVVFDRGGFQYMGAIAALADAAREGGLTF